MLKTNCNEEISFLSTSLPYDSMKEDLEKFSYLNSKSVFYCILEGDLHEIDLEKKSDKIVEAGLVNEKPYGIQRSEHHCHRKRAGYLQE